jgi:deglycase
MKSLVILIENLFEDLELLCPYMRLLEEGHRVTIAGPEGGKEYIGKHGYPYKSDAAVKSLSAADFDGIIIPGGYAPDKLRCNQSVVDLVADFDKRGKLVAFICHAASVPCTSNILKGRKVTCYIAIKADVVNAGANWVDEPVVIDKNFITSRKVSDIPHFCKAIINYLK